MERLWRRLPHVVYRCRHDSSRDTNEAGTVLKFEPNDYVGLTTDSFILVLFSGSPSNDTFVGNAKGIDALYIRPGDYRLVGPETLTKIN